jgi:RNA recognition motif-containing protein
MDIYVGNLPYSASAGDLETVFANYGSVVNVHMVQDRETGRSKGFAFVSMPNAEEAEAAIQALDGSEMGGRPLKVNAARPREERPAGGGGGGGGGFRGGDRGPRAPRFGGGGGGGGGRGEGDRKSFGKKW